MAYLPKFSAVIIKDGSTITIKQFYLTTEARLYYKDAINAGKDAYYYFRAKKRRSNFPYPAPVNITTTNV
jgi:hypothetical protein